MDPGEGHPFSEHLGEYANGRELADAVEELTNAHPELAAKLREVVSSAVFDWRRVLEQPGFSPDTPGGRRAVAQALQFAAETDDTAQIDRLHSLGAPFDLTLRGRGNVLHLAVEQKSFAVAHRLADLGLALNGEPLLFATDCSDDLLIRLLDAGVRFDEHAVLTAAETGAMQGALRIARSAQLQATQPLTERAHARAEQHEGRARQIEEGTLHSYLTPEQYRERAAALRVFAARLEG